MSSQTFPYAVEDDPRYPTANVDDRSVSSRALDVYREELHKRFGAPVSQTSRFKSDAASKSKLNSFAFVKSENKPDEAKKSKGLFHKFGLVSGPIEEEDGDSDDCNTINQNLQGGDANIAQPNTDETEDENKRPWRKGTKLWSTASPGAPSHKVQEVPDLGWNHLEAFNDRWSAHKAADDDFDTRTYDIEKFVEVDNDTVFMDNFGDLWDEKTMGTMAHQQKYTMPPPGASNSQTGYHYVDGQKYKVALPPVGEGDAQHGHEYIDGQKYKVSLPPPGGGGDAQHGHEYIDGKTYKYTLPPPGRKTYKDHGGLGAISEIADNMEPFEEDGQIEARNATRRKVQSPPPIPKTDPTDDTPLINNKKNRPRDDEHSYRKRPGKAGSENSIALSDRGDSLHRRSGSEKARSRQIKYESEDPHKQQQASSDLPSSDLTLEATSSDRERRKKEKKKSKKSSKSSSERGEKKEKSHRSKPEERSKRTTTEQPDPTVRTSEKERQDRRRDGDHAIQSSEKKSRSKSAHSTEKAAEKEKRRRHRSKSKQSSREPPEESHKIEEKGHETPSTGSSRTPEAPAEETPKSHKSKRSSRSKSKSRKHSSSSPGVELSGDRDHGLEDYPLEVKKSSSRSKEPGTEKKSSKHAGEGTAQENGKRKKSGKKSKRHSSNADSGDDVGGDARVHSTSGKEALEAEIVGALLSKQSPAHLEKNEQKKSSKKEKKHRKSSRKSKSEAP